MQHKNANFLTSGRWAKRCSISQLVACVGVCKKDVEWWLGAEELSTNFLCTKRVHTNGEKVSCGWFLEGRRVLRRVVRRDSEEGPSEKHLETETRLFGEYDPLRMRPISNTFRKSWDILGKFQGNCLLFVFKWQFFPKRWSLHGLLIAKERFTLHSLGWAA